MRFIILIISIIILITSCREDINMSTENNILSFSVDTLLFDTVFTTVGSATRYLKVYNTDDADVMINNIFLKKGANSYYKLNIDGEASNLVQNTLLRGGDSLYVFAEVTIDPNNANNALLESDSITFEYANSIQHVNLTAYGQDAYFHSGFPDYQQYEPQSNNLDSMLYCDFFDCSNPNFPKELMDESFTYYSIKEDQIWSNDKPHVIYGDVIIENGATLKIEKGASIHLHNNSWLVVSEESSLHAIGDYDENDLIWFQSDRSDSHSLTDYSNTPGQWGKIWIMPGSVNNKLEHVILKNGKVGVQIDGVNDIDALPKTPMLSIKNSIIYNMSNIGLLAQGSNVFGENLQISNCGQHLMLLNIGGSYEFKHSTFANFWPYSRQTPSLVLNNFYEDINGVIQNRDLINANFYNCIIDGNNETEILFSNSDKAAFNYLFDHCVIKSDQDYLDDWMQNISEGSIRIDNNQSNNFEDILSVPFYLNENSVAIDAGSSIIANEVPYDFNGYSRLPNPDIGCVEKN